MDRALIHAKETKSRQLAPNNRQQATKEELNLMPKDDERGPTVGTEDYSGAETEMQGN